MRIMIPMYPKAIFGLIFLFIVSFRAIGQEAQGNITVEIQTDINGEKKTFKKTYSSEEALQADEELKVLQKETGNLSFSFLGGDNTFIELSSSDSSQSFVIGFDPQSDNAFKSLRLAKSLKEDSALKEVEIEIDEEKVPSKKLTIGPIDSNEFGKKGSVVNKNQLALQPLYYPNPSNGKFELTVDFPEEGPLHIKVYNVNGQEVFVRYFPRYIGKFSETLDLRGQPEGIYLLEIIHDKRRLTRKMMIQ